MLTHGGSELTDRLGPPNDGYETPRLEWTGRKIGDSQLCPRGVEGECVFAERSGTLGQSGLSPIFRVRHERLGGDKNESRPVGGCGPMARPTIGYEWARRGRRLRRPPPPPLMISMASQMTMAMNSTSEGSSPIGTSSMADVSLSQQVPVPIGHS